MEVRPFNRERELITGVALLFQCKEQFAVSSKNIDEALHNLEFNEIPIQRDMERNPEERKP